MSRSISRAHWFLHVNGVNPTSAMRHWLTDTASLTQKLMRHGGRFRVQRLRQQAAVCLADEAAAVGLARRSRVQEREVVLRCGPLPVVFAHTIVPLNATASDWPFFGTLGERSLGASLFGDPRVLRGPMQYARLQAQHPLVRRASAALDEQCMPGSAALYARRRLFQRNQGLLLVTEIFLPAIAEIDVANIFHKQSTE